MAKLSLRVLWSSGYRSVQIARPSLLLTMKMEMLPSFIWDVCPRTLYIEKRFLSGELSELLCRVT